MINVKFVSYSGIRQDVQAKPGESIMQAAVSNGVEGIVGRCGGGAMCGTCHVYVSTDHAGSFPPRHAIEDELLDGAPSPVFENSRLGCQLILDSLHNDIVVRTPEEQD